MSDRRPLSSPRPVGLRHLLYVSYTSRWYRPPVADPFYVGQIDDFSDDNAPSLCYTEAISSSASAPKSGRIRDTCTVTRR
jgi:hypothetical protein